MYYQQQNVTGDACQPASNHGPCCRYHLLSFEFCGFLVPPVFFPSLSGRGRGRRCRRRLPRRRQPRCRWIGGGCAGRRSGRGRSSTPGVPSPPLISAFSLSEAGR
uniref:Uncharacterized protein n=1 Tax=Zea mays TaxID=4577 RepID=C4J3V6_MAIZE|nr:unknown [Zea mays]